MSGLAAARSAGQSRDEEVGALFATHYMAMRRYLIACGCPDCEADDVLQDTILAVRENWEKVRALDKPVAYWYKAASRRFWRLAKERARRFSAGDHEDHLLAIPDPADEVAAVDRRLALMAWIRELPIRQRQVLWLRLGADFDVAETADILSVTPGTVKSQLHDAKERLGELHREDGVMLFAYMVEVVGQSRWETDMQLRLADDRDTVRVSMSDMNRGLVWPRRPATPATARGPPR